MIWLTWRQFRTQAIVAIVALVVVGGALLALGLWMRHAYDSGIATCTTPDDCSSEERAFRSTFATPTSLLSVALLILPALLGSFWGAPLITRELETGTHRMVWTQSVMRRHWLAVKLTIVGGAALALAGAFSLLLTWATDPIVDLAGSRFGALMFGSSNVAPIGYAVFALVLGVAVGLLVRRTVAAMAITIAVFAVIQLAVPFLVREHYMPPVEESVAVTETTLDDVDGLGLTGEPPGADGKMDPDTRVVVNDYDKPGAWMLTPEMELLDPTGSPVDPNRAEPCFRGQGGRGGAATCLAALNLHFDIAYHPASRYWPFQGIETAGFLVLAAVLAGFGLWRIPRGVAAA
jgi:hypothetical protein